MKKVLCICLSSTIQKTVIFDKVLLENVNRSSYYRMDASGKAINSARVLNQLKPLTASVVCPIGQKNKDLFLELSKHDNLDIEYVLIPGFTRECLTLLGKSDASTTELVVSEPKIEFNSKEKEDELLQIISGKLNSAEGVLLAGSRPEYWSEELICKIVKLCKDAGKIFLADYHGKDLLNTFKVSVPDIVKINFDEFVQTFNLPNDILEEDLKNELLNISSKYKNIFIVTRGHKSTFLAFENQIIEEETEKVNPVNTTACGDSFSAGFLYEYLYTKDITLSLKKGTWCASRNAEKEIPGTIL